MRRRFLLGGEGGKKSSVQKKDNDPLQQTTQSNTPSAPTFPFLSVLNRRSFAAADGPKKNKNAASNNYYSAFKDENDKYATIGGGSKQQKKKDEENGLRTSSAHSSSSPPPPQPPPRRSPLLQRCGRRPRSMGAPLLQQMGMKCGNITERNNNLDEEAETAFMNVEDFPVGSARLIMNGRCCQTQQPHGVEKSNNVNYNNRNSTSSTNSSQTSSGFESSKSASSHQLAQPTGCPSTPGHQLQLQSDPHPPFQISPKEDNSASSPSSRLSSTGSSTATTQGGRSSAYFSLSDGLDLSSTGIGEIESGTLTTILRKGERPSKTERARRGNCSRVNIGDMLAKGIPEQEIFAEWLQRLCLPEYLALFLAQGYDLPTLARATPEDLTTLGITKPDDRKCLVQDIQCWRNVTDNWPTDISKESPTRDWLTAIGLKQYIQQFERQGCLTVEELEQLEAEDLEDMGVQKLGHAKRIWLALRKLREARSSKPKSIQKVPSVVQPFSSHNILPSTTLWPCSSDSATVASSATLRRPQRNPSMNNNPTSGAEVPKLREIDQREKESTGRVQFRNSSFGIDPLPDRGPPRLNLYRTSQIIAQLPREPPELIEKEDDVEELSYLMGHIPPPPAPMPLLPLLAFPSTSSTSTRPVGSFGCSLSQPTTPRNAQRMFGPFEDIQQQNFQQKSQNLTFLRSPNNRRENKTILFSSQLPQRNGFVVQSSDLTELCGSGTNGRSAASAR